MSERVFLGSNTHLLPACAEWLVDQSGVTDGVIDLRTHMVAVPTRRARRRLEHLLLEGAASRGARLVPPELLTVGRLLDRALVPGRSTADAVTTDLAWLLAVADASEETIEALTGHHPCGEAEQRRLAQRLSRLDRQMATADLRFDEVSDRLEAAGLPSDGARWDAAACVARAMCLILDASGRESRDEGQARSLETQRVFLGDVRHLHIISAELGPRTTRLVQMLEQLGVSVSRLIHGEHSHGFDSDGELDIDWWNDCEINLDDVRLTPCALVEDQIAVAFDHLSRLGDAEASMTRLVVPDDDLMPMLDAAARLENIPLDRFTGPTVREGRVGRFLEGCAEVLETASARALGALIRHDDVVRWLESRGQTHPVASWDRLWTRHLPDRLEDATGDLCEAMSGLMEPLRGEARIAVWAGRIAEVVNSVFEDAPSDIGRTAEDLRYSMETLREALTELHELPDAGSAVSCDVVLRGLVQHLDGVTIPTDEPTGGVEVLGWLDAHLDDAPDIVVTSMNADSIPGSPETDGWLTESQRDAIGLPSFRRRAARDAYLLSAMIQSGRSIHLTWARRTNEGDPIAPSNLLLRPRGMALAERLEQGLIDDLPTDVPRLSSRQDALRAPVDLDTAFDPMPIPSGDPVIESISVSAFRTWLESPWRFLLARDARIRAERVETASELDPMSFGTLVHAALHVWGERECQASSVTIDPDTVRVDMHDALDCVVGDRFGGRPMASVRLQVAIARHRLTSLAPIQAAHAAQGWRIAHLEHAFKWPGTAPRFPDDDGLAITGSIDRIDQHEVHGWRALDYKTSVKAHGPMAVHGSAGRWKDLQLPLYRVLAASAGIDIAPDGLGYMLIPPDHRRCRIEWATWSEADLDDACDTAAECVRQIVGGTFMDTVRAEVEECTA